MEPKEIGEQKTPEEAEADAKDLLQKITALQQECPHAPQKQDFVTGVTETKPATFCKNCGARL